MAQTANDGNKTTQKLNRPGQRQQERLQRIARRRRRTQIIVSIFVALLLIGVGITGFVQYQGYTKHQQDLAVAATGTSTAKANVKATAQANVTGTAVAQATITSATQLIAPIYAGTPIPTVGPRTPPALTGTIVKSLTGLEYFDVKVGTGAVAKAGSTVSVEYTGWLASSGQKFDSSFDRHAVPYDVTPLGTAQVIPGWNEGLVGMKVGGTRRLLIPPTLAYGSQANGPIPANSVLLFDVTVVAVK